MTSEPAARPPLDAELLAAGGGRPPVLRGLSVEVVDQAGSTNALVAERARAGAGPGLVVVAEHQTAGRGRLDRTWEAPERSALTFSVLLRPTVPARSWPWLPLLAGHAVATTLREAGFEAEVKWPNDVLIADRKVAGVLVERIETGGGPAAVVGIGLNVRMTADELPVPEATSLALSAPDGTAPDRTDLLVALLQTLWQTYTAWEEGGDPAARRLADSYAATCATVGREVRVDLPSGEVLTGLATGIDPSGRLLVERGGARTAVNAGDVVHVRDA